jgi:rare lipoprotein A
MSAIATGIKNFRQRFSTFAGVALAGVLSIAGTQTALPAATNTTQPTTGPQPAKDTHHWYEIGKASWYGKYFQGHETASGEQYDMNGLTCAHRSLPLGSLIRVTNLRNHKSVVVRVNDRGPVPASRVIDLSFAAANFLGFSMKGTAPVRLDLVNATAELAQLSFPSQMLAIQPR